MRLGSVAKIIAAGAAVALLSGVAFASMNSNNVQHTYAGYGANVVDGYTISNVDYHISDDGTHVNGVEMDVAPIPGYITVWFGDGTPDGHTGQAPGGWWHTYNKDGKANEGPCAMTEDVANNTAHLKCLWYMNVSINQIKTLQVTATQ